ncbi:hypothetical protein [Schumannella soli]|uniref:Uncharacterized protein n=1 Tax=Schumannella soli TaxID=2590779 RepID=A0A506XZ98_9MICO|nr:hypothetical protein [Schumannella soli]TPW78101.1 hypothetical protein FJ657_05605 [Schumannella soli]
MLYGPRTREVTAFIETLPSLTKSDWEEGKSAAVQYQPDLLEKLDHASVLVVSTLTSNPQLDAALSAAKPHVVRIVDSFQWNDDANSDLRLDVLWALGAIVVFDELAFDDLLVRFRPFRLSTVAVPVLWSRSLLD